MLVSGIASPQVHDGGVVAASEVHELLSKIHDILDNAGSEVVGPSQSLGSGLMCINTLCWSLVVPPW